MSQKMSIFFCLVWFSLISSIQGKAEIIHFLVTNQRGRFLYFIIERFSTFRHFFPPICRYLVSYNLICFLIHFITFFYLQYLLLSQKLLIVSRGEWLKRKFRISLIIIDFTFLPSIICNNIDLYVIIKLLLQVLSKVIQTFPLMTSTFRFAFRI